MAINTKRFLIVPFGMEERDVAESGYEVIYESPSFYDEVIERDMGNEITRNYRKGLLGQRFISYEKILTIARLLDYGEIEIKVADGDGKPPMYCGSHKENLSRLLEGRSIRMDGNTVRRMCATMNDMSDVDISECWNRFDGVYAICCEKYQDRMNDLKKELGRVDLLPKVEFVVDYPNPFIDLLANTIKFSNQSAHQRTSFRCGYSHYKTILEAYHRGKNHILLIEDDIVFLKNKKRLAEAVNGIPNDFDFAMLDKNPNEKAHIEGIESKKQWDTYERFNSSGCYAMSRAGMARFIENYEHGLATRNLRNNDNYFWRSAMGNDLHLYAAYPNLAVQREYSTSVSYMNTYYQKLALNSVRLGDYNFPVVPRVDISSLEGDKGKKEGTGNGYRIGGNRVYRFSQPGTSTLKEYRIGDPAFRNRGKNTDFFG